MRAVRGQQSAGVIEMEMAHRDDVDRAGIESCAPQGLTDPRSLVPAHRAGLLVDALADARLDEDPARRRLDEEAVQRLVQPVLGIDLVRCPTLPQDLRHWTEQGAGIGSERAGLDERDMDPAAEVASPVDRIVQPRGAGSFDSFGSCGPCPLAKSRWKADAVGSDWPWYFDPSDGDPYGR